jgi:hypothetical protein
VAGQLRTWCTGKNEISIRKIASLFAILGLEWVASLSLRLLFIAKQWTSERFLPLQKMGISVRGYFPASRELDTNPGNLGEDIVNINGTEISTHSYIFNREGGVLK